jgi:murein DD-endopeptidase MepM/ murein hydrolase activator NlpD
MRCTEFVSRVAATGFILAQIGSLPALADVSHDTPDLRQRVFFSREAEAWPGEVATIVPVAQQRIPLTSVGEMMPVAAGRGAVTVLASLAPARDGPVLDTGLPPWATPRPLPWATTPAVPRPLSEPPPQIETLEKRRAPEAGLPTLPEPPHPAMVQGRAGAKQAIAHSLWAERDGEHLSRLQGTPKFASHAGDPIAALEFEEETPAPPQVAAPAFIMPFANGRVTSLYNQGRRHPAIDLAGPLGSVVMSTTMRQTVVFTGWRGGYGNAVIARDPIGRLHLYGHLRSITARVGEILDQGVKLGHLGSTGHSTGPHVHYEVRDGKGGHINPVTLLFPGRSAYKGFAWSDVRLPARPTTVASVHPRPR